MIRGTPASAGTRYTVSAGAS